MSTDREETVGVSSFSSYAFIYEFAGYHWFTAGEDSCLMGQTFTCVDESLCNRNPPYSSSN